MSASSVLMSVIAYLLVHLFLDIGVTFFSGDIISVSWIVPCFTVWLKTMLPSFFN